MMGGRPVSTCFATGRCPVVPGKVPLGLGVYVLAKPSVPLLAISFPIQDMSFAPMPETLQVTHRSLFDGSLQGVRHVAKRAFGFQGHPEASPGPHDIGELFDLFVADMRDAAGARLPV